MSKIIRDYWTFDKNTKLTPYKLGQIIDLNNESLFLKKDIDTDFDYEYVGPENFLWIVTVIENQITQLIYKNKAPFPNIAFWSDNYELIKFNLEKTSQIVDKSHTGSKMYVVSRDYWVNLIFFILGDE